MSYRDSSRHYPQITRTRPTPFSYSSVEFFLSDEDAAQLTRRTVKITDRRTAEVTERKSGSSSSALFSIPPVPAETVKKWSDEQTVEIEETFE